MKRIHWLILFIALQAGMVSYSSAQTPHYAAIYGWAFPNYTTPVLSWDIYRDTFIGIPPDPPSSGFDWLFYDLVYRTELAGEGNCYGLSLMSLMMRKKGGHLGYCLPVSQYSGDSVSPFTGPNDPFLGQYINQMHGHQVNVPSLKQYLELIATGKNRDGLFAFQQAQYYQAQDDYTLVSITESLFPTDGGHTMVAYETRGFGPNDKRIYVYDPNRSWYVPTQQTFYTSGSNFIQIRADHSWSFDKGGGVVWSGDPSSGGNCTITPISIAGPRSRTPSSLGFNAIDFASEFFIFGEGTQLEQITSEDGKRLFKPGTHEVEIDPNLGMLNIVPFYPSDQVLNDKPYNFATYYQLEKPTGSVDVQVRSERGGYRLDVAGPRSHFRIVAKGGVGTDLLKIRDYGTLAPQMSLHNHIDAGMYDIELTQIVEPNQEARIFRLINLKVPSRIPIDIGISPDRSGLDVISQKVNLDVTLQIESIGRGYREVVDIPNLRIQPGEQLNVKPDNWRNLNDRDLKINIGRIGTIGTFRPIR
ncbi:MAG: hypothetical protein ACOX5R_13390 [bacterium]